MLRIVAREVDRGDDAAQRAGDESYVGSFDRDVGAGADRKADVSLGQRGASLMPSPAMPTRGLRPAGGGSRWPCARAEPRQYSRDADLPGYRGSGTGVVAGDHHNL